MTFKVKSKTPKEKKLPNPKNPYIVDGQDMSKVPIYYLEGDNGLSEAQEKALWQYGVDTGIVWSLQGWYGRNASAMLEAGYLKYPKKKTHDYYGNPIPTQDDVKSMKEKK